jgi:hypothetical protein
MNFSSVGDRFSEVAKDFVPFITSAFDIQMGKSDSITASTSVKDSTNEQFNRLNG